MYLISDVKGVGPATAKALAEKGFRSAEQLAKAGAPDIVVVSGIGDARANTLIAAAKALLAVADAPEKPASKKPDKGGKKKKSAKQAAKAKKKAKKKAKGAGKGSKKMKSKKKSKGKKK